jgi:hypothetical protein
LGTSDYKVTGEFAEPSTLELETLALFEAMIELGLNTGILVARNENERLNMGTGTIQVIPSWWFFLDLPKGV